MTRLPEVGGDSGTWGDVLNDFLAQSHNDDGTLRAGTVGATQLKPQSVSNTALANDTIQEAKLAASIRAKLNASSPALADGSVTNPMLADGAVSPEKVSSLGYPNGFASLDGAGKLPEAQLPTRLAQEQLSGTITSHLNAGAAAFAGVLVASSRPVVVGAVGDSTTTPWFGQFVDWLATRVPHRTVVRRVWSDAKQGYPSIVTVSIGSEGDRYVTGAGVWLSVPDSSATSVTGDIDVRVKVALSDWSPSSLTSLASKNGPDGQRSWWFDASASGALQFSVSSNGSTFVTRTSTASVPFSDGAPGWARVTLDTDNDAGGHDVKFYTSTNGTTWTQLGSTVTNSGALTLFDNSVPTQLAGRGGGGWAEGIGRMYALRILDGIDGPPVVDIDLDMLPGVGTTFIDFCGNTVTLQAAANATRAGSLGLAVFDASVGGSAIGYAADVARFAKQMPAAVDLGIINYGHTGGLTTAADYLESYRMIIDAYTAKNPYVALLGSIENPQTSPRTAAQIAAHEARQDAIRAYLRSGGLGYLDAYSAFGLDERPMTELVADGVHPTTAGYALWAHVAKSILGPLT